MRRLASCTVLALALITVPRARILAQWSLAAELGSDRYWGGSVENAPEQRSFRPYRPTTFSIALGRELGRVGAALRLRYTDASLGLEGSDAVVAIKGIVTVLSAAPEITYRVATLAQDNQLLLHAGPLIERWSIEGEQSRTRLGAQGGVSLRIPMGGRFAVAMAAGAALTASPFTEDELDASYSLRPLWRRGFTGGLHYRL
jgi:hypothetical protein